MKIFVSIASYCDNLLFFTIKDCIAKADKPENLVFAVVDQNLETQKEKIEALGLGNQIRYVYINQLDALGVSWARNIAFSLYDDEEYLLQVDSHMLFEQSWDTILLEQHKKLQKKSPKPIITTYPYDFSLDENEKPIFKEQPNTFALMLRPHPDTKLTQESAVLRFRAYHKPTKQPEPGCHIAGGFIFTSGQFTQEVPYDPFLYFHGEEQSLAIRAYTRGWDIYHPNHIPMYHMYKKINEEHLTHHWHKSVEGKRALKSTHLRERAKQRINRLFYGDGMKNTPYGLGNKRTLKEYIKFSGINYKSKTIEIRDYMKK